MRKTPWTASCHPLAHLFGIRLRRPQPEPRASTSTTINNVIPLRPVTRAPKVDPIDPDDEMLGQGPVANARRRERERCEAILSCAAASTLPMVARALAFKTTLSRREAIAMLALPVFAPVGRQRGM